MTSRTLTDLREEMRAVARGEGKPSARPAASLLQALSREAVDLLKLLIQERPATVAEIANRMGRAQSNVSRSLHQLASLGLVTLTRNGREVRPEAVVSKLEIDFATGTYATHRFEAEIV